MILKDNITKGSGLATCIIFATSVVSIFFNVREIFGSTYINIIIIGIYFGCLVYTLSTKRITFNNQEVLSFLFLSVTLLLNINNNKVMSFVGLITLSVVLQKNKFALPRWFVDILHSSVLIYLLYNLIYGERYNELYYILSGKNDPNFTAYTFLLYLVFSLKNRSILGILLSVIGGLLTFSRAFVYSSILIFTLLALQNLSFKINFLSRYLIIAKKLTNSILLFKDKFIFVSIILIINSFFFIYGDIIVNGLQSDKIVSRGEINRVFNISANDIIRFEANDYMINFFHKNPQEFLFGGSLSYDDLEKKPGMKTPHNGLIHSIVTRGFLFTFLYLSIAGFILNRFDAIKNIAFWLPPFFFSVFLHVGFSIDVIALIIIIVGMQEGSIKNSWFSIPFLSFILKLFPRKLKNG
jgi:hypothetical protein